jgi:SOS-response transcriptional repressor LexA
VTRDDKDREARQVRAWMRDVMSEKEWSAQRWADLAGTSATNITRFLKDSKFTPSTVTIAKLSRVAGSMPNLGRVAVAQVPTERGVPLYKEKDLKDLLLRKGSSETLRAERYVYTTQRPSEGAFAFRSATRSLELRGILAGDTLICEPATIQQPRDGDVVVYDRDGAAHFQIGYFESERIVHYSTERLPPVELSEVVAVGVAIEVRRTLHPKR